MKKVFTLVDSRACRGRTVRELRNVLQQIDRGELVGVNFVTIKRNGGLYAYSDNDCQIRALGSVEILKTHIINKKFENK